MVTEMDILKIPRMEKEEYDRLIKENCPHTEISKVQRLVLGQDK